MTPITPYRGKTNGSRFCLSCGTNEHMARRRYCSPACRQQLLYTLDVRTGLLRALNTRYATFYFTDFIIIMDILPYGSEELLSFIYPRSSGQKPAEDFCRLSDCLGNKWWAEKKRTRKHYLASQHLYDQALRTGLPAETVMPYETRIPAVNKEALVQLRLAKGELNSPDLLTKIKGAYRNQVKKHHPDLGGDSATFRKIHQAYQDLICWAENPSFLKRRGFPDKWFYAGATNRWTKPAPHLNPYQR